MIEPSERGTFNPLGGESCVYSTTRINMLSNFFTVNIRLGRITWCNGKVRDNSVVAYTGIYLPNDSGSCHRAVGNSLAPRLPRAVGRGPWAWALRAMVTEIQT